MEPIKVTLFTNTRDEHNVIEWVLYHKIIGFDEIVVFDHLSIVPVSSYLDNNIPNVTVIREEEKGAIKRKLFQKAYEMGISNHSTYVMYIDMDEYVVLKGYSNVKDFIRKMGLHLPGICLNWVFYGNERIIHRTKNLLIEDFNYCVGDNNHGSYTNTLVKCLQRMDCIKGACESPHNFKYKTKAMKPVNVFGHRMKKVAINPFTRGLSSNPHIAHIVNGSVEDFNLRKVRRVRDDTGVFHNFANNMNFIRPSEKYPILENYLKDNFTDKIYKLMDEYGLRDANEKLKTTWCPRLENLDALLATNA